jgi:aerobic-type carbon monoxide dehydrogenase small subunit (CoxS/CutS family)
MIIIVNGVKHDVECGDGDRLSDVLRGELGLIGVRVSCAEGECGSCTIMLDDRPVTSCLVLARQAEDAAVITVEGIGTHDRLHAIQEAFVEEQAFQCAFCTPGFIMSTYAFLKENADPTDEEAADAVAGNICRCGSHPYIVKAVVAAAKKVRERA